MNLLALRRWCALAGLLLGLLAGPQSAHAEGWRQVKSEHFIIRTNAAADVYAPLVERLETVHEALRESFFAGVPTAPVQVLLFADAPSFRAVAPAGLTGFYSAHVPTLLPGFDDGVIVLPATGAPFAEIARTAAHELGHHFLHALGDRVPRWLHEGFAKYVGALVVEGDEVVFDAARPRLRRARPFVRPVPLPLLLAATGADFRGPAARRHYLSAWLLVRELLGARTDLADHFQRLVAQSVLAKSRPAQAAWLVRAGARSLPTLGRDLDSAFTALAGDTPLPSRQPPVRVRISYKRRPLAAAPIDPGEIAALTAALRVAATPVEAVAGSR